MIAHWIAQLLNSYGYLAVFLLIALESLGLPLPGESALIAAALYTGTTHHLNVSALFGTAAAAAIIGDNAGYWIGRTGGQRLATRYGHYVRLGQPKLTVGRYLFARHGVSIVLLGRFVAVLRTYAAFFAGIARMRWSRFLMANAAGGVLWSGLYAYGAYALGNAASGVSTTITIVGLTVTGVFALAMTVLARKSFQRLQERAERAFPNEHQLDEANPRHPAEANAGV
jgi:membrane protein DedA with SNARE-associated domain